MNYIRTNILKLIVSLLFILSFNSCDDESNQVIPYVHVNLSIDLNILNDLTIPGNSLLFPEFGFGGIYVYCEYYNPMAPAQSVFHAFDAACTFETTPSSEEIECITSNEDNLLIVECPCCGSMFSLMDGYVTNEPATRPLQEYKVVILNNELRISNY